MKQWRARSARSEGNVRPGPRNCIRRHIVADSFRLGPFLQVAGSSAADKSRTAESAKFTTGWHAIGSGGKCCLRRRCEVQRGCSAGSSGEFFRSGSQRRKNRGGAEPAVSRGTIEPRRRGENLATEQIYGRPEAAAAAGFGERQRGAAAGLAVFAGDVRRAAGSESEFSALSSASRWRSGD